VIALLKLEREVFIAGHQKAFLLFMDSCGLCAECVGKRETGKNPRLARPSPEAMAIDVFATVRHYGYPIEIKNFKGIGLVEILLGGILILLSIVWFISIQKDIDRALPIFQPVAIMTSEPIKLLAISLFLAGIITLIAGSYCLFQYKKALSNKSR